MTAEERTGLHRLLHDAVQAALDQAQPNPLVSRADYMRETIGSSYSVELTRRVRPGIYRAEMDYEGQLAQR